MTTNKYLNVRIDQLKSERKYLSDVRFKLFNNIAEIHLLRIFYKNIIKNGLQSAIDALPKDKENTPDINEEVTVEKLEKTAKKFDLPFPEDLSNIEDIDEISADLDEELTEDASKVKLKIRRYIAMTMVLDYQLEDIDTDVEDMRNLQRRET